MYTRMSLCVCFGYVFILRFTLIFVERAGAKPSGLGSYRAACAAFLRVLAAVLELRILLLWVFCNSGEDEKPH